MSIQQASAPLPRSRKLLYGVGNLAYALPHQVVASVLLFYSTAILGIPAGRAALIVALSIAWDAVTDPLLGFLTDHTHSRRLGRRHPYLAAGVVAIALTTWALWSLPPDLSESAKVLLLLVLLLAFKTGLTVFVVPFNALGAELASGYDDRTSVQSYRATFHLLGMIVALVGSNLYFFRSTPEFERGQLNPEAYPAMGFSFALLALLAGALCFLGTARYIPRLEGPSSPAAGRLSGRALAADLARAGGNRNLMALVWMIFTIELGFQAGIALGFHVNTYTYRLPAPTIGLLVLLLLGCSVLSQPFWVWVSRRWEKKTGLYLGAALAYGGFVGMPVTHVWWGVFPIDGELLPLTLAFFHVLAGIGNGAYMSLPFSMLADAADAETRRTGRRDEGMYFGLYTFAYKLGSSVSLLAGGLILTSVGFDSELTEQTERARFLLAMAPAALLTLVLPGVLYFISRFRLRRADFAIDQASPMAE